MVSYADFDKAPARRRICAVCQPRCIGPDCYRYLYSGGGLGPEATILARFCRVPAPVLTYITGHLPADLTHSAHV